MLNTSAANRRQALRASVRQAVFAFALSLTFMWHSVEWFQAAAVGGGAVVAGNMLFAWRSFPATAVSSGLALSGLLSGIALKWLVVLSTLYVALAQMAMPPLPLLAGLAGTTCAFLFVGKFKS